MKNQSLGTKLRNGRVWGCGLFERSNPKDGEIIEMLAK